MQPIIGVTCSQDMAENREFLPQAYVSAVTAAGGVPVILPSQHPGPFESRTFIDGLLLSGGGDLDPVHWGEELHPAARDITPDRDLFELALTRWCLKAGIPVLGICRGIQVLNVAAGGDLFQDIHTQVHKSLAHQQQVERRFPTHKVRLLPGTRLFEIYQAGLLEVNSLHHQAVRRVAGGAVASAVAPDGIVEGIEIPTHPFAIGIQWHPEALWRLHPEQLGIFQALVGASRVVH